MNIVPFQAGYFNGGAPTWASMGKCSNAKCKHAPADFAILKKGSAIRALCTPCKERYEKKLEKASGS